MMTISSSLTVTICAPDATTAARVAAEEAAGIAPPETPSEGFRLLHGCELEIRADGTLDYEDDLLAYVLSGEAVATSWWGRRLLR